MSKYNKGDKFEIEIEEAMPSCLDGKAREGVWNKRYFSKYENGLVHAWDSGKHRGPQKIHHIGNTPNLRRWKNNVCSK